MRTDRDGDDERRGPGVRIAKGSRSCEGMPRCGYRGARHRSRRGAKRLRRDLRRLTSDACRGQASAFDLGGGDSGRPLYHHLSERREMIALHDELLPGDIEWHRRGEHLGRGQNGHRKPLELLRYEHFRCPTFALGAQASITARGDWEARTDIARRLAARLRPARGRRRDAAMSASSGRKREDNIGALVKVRRAGACADPVPHARSSAIAQLVPRDASRRRRHRRRAARSW